jgi:Na+/H+-dicarboxylate symporter
MAGALAATFLVSLSIAAVPSASIVSLAPALATIGVPLDGLGILLGVDRIPDMFRTTVNVTGDVGAAVLMKGLAEGEAAARPGA